MSKAPPAPPRRREAAEVPAFASRGGLKLQAALDAFALRAAVRGRNALDVGASTGGFTDCLLRAGAAHVTGVDVGHGQMIERLREDSRVTLIEDTHFKLAPLSVAAGPFDFFVVDVSFASARSMLRGIAKRITPGVEGVVLVKPQFELPKELVPRGGVIASRNLRKLAFNRFKKKAWALGFRVVAKVDSPVPGGEGSVEILAWLRWEGFPPDEVERPPHPEVLSLNAGADSGAPTHSAKRPATGPSRQRRQGKEDGPARPPKRGGGK